jgi:hypothetical protein
MAAMRRVLYGANYVPPVQQTMQPANDQQTTDLIDLVFFVCAIQGSL